MASRRARSSSDDDADAVLPAGGDAAAGDHRRHAALLGGLPPPRTRRPALHRVPEPAPSAVARLLALSELESERPAEASEQKPETASLFNKDEQLSPKERKLLQVLRTDEATQIDMIIERVEAVMSSSEVFAVLFELELNGRIKQLPGKQFVKSF